MESEGNAVQVVATALGTHRQVRLEEWWRPIPRTPTTETFVTSSHALNIPHGDVWAGWHTMLWHMRLEGTGEAIERTNQARMGRSSDWPWWDETSLRDAREGLATLGHPAAKRAEPVYAATFARVVAEWVVETALVQGEALAYPQPRETKGWLSTREQRDQLRELLAGAAKAQGQLEESIRAWQERTGL